MIKSIITGKEFLTQKFNECDIQGDPYLPSNIQDLLDTAKYWSRRCAGLAFPQIGILKRGFVIKVNGIFQPVINPQIISKSTAIKSRFESCLSLPQQEPIKVRRSITIKISYYDPFIKENCIQKFGQFEARVVQHEIDHLNGILIGRINK